MLISASACGGKESGVYDLNDHAFTLSQLSGKDALGREISPAGASAEKNTSESIISPGLTAFTTTMCTIFPKSWQNTRKA